MDGVASAGTSARRRVAARAFRLPMQVLVTMTPQPTLLVIDDEPSVLALVDRFARDFRVTVISRSDAGAALAELPVLKPDAVMVDLRMPHIDGLNMLRAIRDIDPTCQVILMTGNPSVDTAIDAVKLGALDYLSKPFDLQRSTPIRSPPPGSIRHFPVIHVRRSNTHCRAARGNKAAAARLLGISRRSMYRWLERLDLS